MNDDKKSKKKLNTLLGELVNVKEDHIRKILDGLQVHADFSAIEPLFNELKNNKSSIVKEEIIEFLSNLKDSPAKVTVMDCLIQDKFKAIRNEILQTIWNSPLDYSEFLFDFVKLAVEGDFMIAVESLTILENLDGPFEEKTLFDAQLLLLNNAKENKVETQKAQLLSEIALLLKEFETNIID